MYIYHSLQDSSKTCVRDTIRGGHIHIGILRILMRTYPSVKSASFYLLPFFAIYTIANVTNGQRDRQTDGQTDRLNFYNSTWRSHIALRSHKTRTFNVISALFWGSCPALSWDLWLSGGTKKSSSPAFQRTGSRVRRGRYPQLPRL